MSSSASCSTSHGPPHRGDGVVGPAERALDLARVAERGRQCARVVEARARAAPPRSRRAPRVRGASGPRPRRRRAAESGRAARARAGRARRPARGPFPAAAATSSFVSRFQPAAASSIIAAACMPGSCREAGERPLKQHARPGGIAHRVRAAACRRQARPGLVADPGGLGVGQAELREQDVGALQVVADDPRRSHRRRPASGRAACAARCGAASESAHRRPHAAARGRTAAGPGRSARQLALRELVELARRSAGRPEPRPRPPGNPARPRLRRPPPRARARATPRAARSGAPGSSGAGRRERRHRRRAPPDARRTAGCPRPRRPPARLRSDGIAGLAWVSSRRVCPSSRRSRATRRGVRARSPPRPALGELRPCGADDQQRLAAAASEQLVDDVEQHIVGPVHILEHDHHRLTVAMLPIRRDTAQPTSGGRGRPLGSRQAATAAASGSPGNRSAIAAVASARRPAARPARPRAAAPATTPPASLGNGRSGP